MNTKEKWVVDVDLGLFLSEDGAFFDGFILFVFQAEFLVLTLRDLFQVVYENKKKEMESVKQEQDAETKRQEEEDKKVVKLGGDLATESSTDDEPVYSVSSVLHVYTT